MEARELVAALIQGGMTQVEIAGRTEIPQPTISKILRGDVKDVMSRNYRKLLALHQERSSDEPGAPAVPEPAKAA